MAADRVIEKFLVHETHNIFKSIIPDVAINLENVSLRQSSVNKDYYLLVGAAFNYSITESQLIDNHDLLIEAFNNSHHYMDESQKINISRIVPWYMSKLKHIRDSGVNDDISNRSSEELIDTIKQLNKTISKLEQKITKLETGKSSMTLLETKLKLEKEQQEVADYEEKREKKRLKKIRDAEQRIINDVLHKKQEKIWKIARKLEGIFKESNNELITKWQKDSKNIIALSPIPYIENNELYFNDISFKLTIDSILEVDDKFKEPDDISDIITVLSAIMERQFDYTMADRNGKISNYLEMNINDEVYYIKYVSTTDISLEPSHCIPSAFTFIGLYGCAFISKQSFFKNQGIIVENDLSAPNKINIKPYKGWNNTDKVFYTEAKKQLEAKEIVKVGASSLAILSSKKKTKIILKEK